MTQYYTHDIAGCLADRVGSAGIASTTLDAMIAKTAPALDALRTAYDTGTLPLLRLPAAHADLEAVEGIAARFIESFDDVVVLGTGGSSLGGRTLCALARPNPASPRLHFLDNIDGDTFERLFAAIDPKRTGFIVISKSGSTAETLSQMFHCLDVFRTAIGAEGIAKAFVAITEPGDNPLRRVARRWGMETLDHDPAIGGRYSALSIVGLLPAMIAGLDADAVRAGARSVLDPVLEKGAAPGSLAPVVGAALSVALSRQDIGTTVMMPYVDRLADFGLWYRQLWAESVGKDGKGTTPIRALGTVDQHSQLQLYLDGPRDKMFSVILSKAAGTGGAVPKDLADDPRLAYLAGRTLGDLLDAEQRATAETLIARGCPTRILSVDQIDEHSVGALMMHYFVETIVAAHLFGVDPFDQPAVEEGKIRARQYLEESART